MPWLALDLTIILAYFALVTSLGLYMGRREKSLEDFALGGRSVPWWAVMASIIAAETSAATFLGVPAEGFAKRSLAYTQLAYGLILGRVVVAYLFLKPFYDLKVYTVYDYLGHRFGPLTKGYVSALFLLMRTLASGTRLFIPSLVMVQAWKLLVTHSSDPAAALAGGSVREYVTAIVLLTLLTCIYTAVGGIKAVIWTDLLQASLMITAAVAAVLTLLFHLSNDSWHLSLGFQNLAHYVPEMTTLRGYLWTGFEQSTVTDYMSKNNVQEMSPLHYLLLFLSTDYTLPATLIGYTVMCTGVFGTDQDMVQRMLTAPDYKKSQRSVIVAALMDLPIFATFAFIGVLLYAFYQLRPDLKPAAGADVFGTYIMTVMPPGLRGLVLAGIFATAMGSLSAALNALATSLTNDWYAPYLAPNRPPHHYVTAARLCTAIFALLMIAIAGWFAYAKVIHPDLRIIPVVLGVAGLLVGPMLAVFLVGLLTKSRGSDVGNVIGLCIGVTVSGVLLTTQIRFTWYALLSCTAVFTVSLLFKTPVSRKIETGERLMPSPS